MKTTSEILQEELLSGRHINKFDFLSLTGSVCLAQRILELRQMGWNIRDKAIEGKGNLREYWLEQSEITRIQEIARIREKTIAIERFSEEKEKDEQLFIPQENIAETSQKQAETEKYEQMGFGLLGGHNY